MTWCPPRSLASTLPLPEMSLSPSFAGLKPVHPIKLCLPGWPALAPAPAPAPQESKVFLVRKVLVPCGKPGFKQLDCDSLIARTPSCSHRRCQCQPVLTMVLHLNKIYKQGYYFLKWISPQPPPPKEFPILPFIPFLLPTSPKYMSPWKVHVLL